jgi:hypothetical protein
MLFIIDFFWFLFHKDGLCENGHGNGNNSGSNNNGGKCGGEDGNFLLLTSLPNFHVVHCLFGPPIVHCFMVVFMLFIISLVLYWSLSQCLSYCLSFS